MKPSIKRREAGELRILAITLIANSTEILAAGIHGHTEPDIDAAITMAVDLFVNRGELPANAVARGVQHARDRIMHREALMLCAVVMIKNQEHSMAAKNPDFGQTLQELDAGITQEKP